MFYLNAFDLKVLTVSWFTSCVLCYNVTPWWFMHHVYIDTHTLCIHTYMHFIQKVLFHVMYYVIRIYIQLQVYIESITLHTVYIMYSLTTNVLFAYSSVGSTNLPLLLVSSSERKWPWSSVS